MTTTDKLFTAAVNLGLITASNLVAYGATHGADADGCAAILADLDDVADCLRHCNPTRRAAWIAVREAAHFFELDRKRKAAGEADDRHGFRAEARAASKAAFAAAGIRP